ncbi:MAG: amino acid adenylation domain-containing protein, partial [Calditrichales bacterium]|nr:amino acid adenylation domain-containing protein [Calditrichales bacterium]
MSDISSILEKLSPEKRRLLEIQLKKKASTVKTFPVSYAQQRLWFLDQFEPGSPYYNIPIALRLKGPFNLDLFKKTIQHIVNRHESLRTTFISKNGKPLQALTPVLTLQIPVEDISHLPTKEREDKTIELATQEARKPFNLEKGPLMRVSVIKVSDTGHVILSTMHHIISDGWSIGVLVTEITQLYDAFSKGQPSTLPKLPIQYPDYAAWQKKYLEGEVFEKQLDFWKEHLFSIPPVLELPTDRPRPAVRTNEGSSFTRLFSKEITDKLNKLSRQNKGTLFMTLLAAFKVLLYRLSGQTDISIGTPIANRTRGEVEGLIGLFINTMVLYTHLDDNPTFRQLISRVRKTTLASYENQDLPFEYLVDALQPDRDMSASPLFQVMFILQNAPSDNRKIADLTMEMIPVDMGTSTFDLTFSATESSIGLGVSVEYNTDLFDRTTVERFMDYFETLLKNILINPDQHIANIPILENAERQKILFDWNNYSAKRDKNLCIHHLFEKQVEETPDAPAVFYSGQTVTYNELNKKANQIAHYLKQFNIGPEIPVGILLERSVDLLTVVLGVLKTGSAYLPLDPSYPEERLQYMLKDAGVPLLITQESLTSLISNYSNQVLNLDEKWDEITVKADSNPDSEVVQENLVYLIYTSGSTGKSKGTMVRHSSLVNAYLAWAKVYELRGKAKSHLQMASFSFDVFSGDWTRALCSGGKLVLATREILLEADQLYNLMINEQIDTAEFVPAVLRNLIQYLEKNEKNLNFMYNLIAGSDVWYIDEYNKFRKFCGLETRLINSYGLTEATIDSTFFEADSINLPPERLVPIGRPFDNMTVYILDNYFEPVPASVRGELFLGGDGLGRGYLNRPDLTAEKFIPNPFSDEPGERLYRTGDQGRYLPNGSVEFLGRADNQVKLRGFRIELGEIETALNKHDFIKENVVAVHESKDGDKRLAAFVVPKNSTIPGVNELRSFLKTHLPDYMLPSIFVTIERIPVSATGKIDRKALVVPDDLQMKSTEEFIAPRTPTEEMVANIFSEVLNIKLVGAADNFFELGGHSLIATQVISRIRDHLNIELPLRDLFQTPTVEKLAETIEKALLQKDGVEPLPIVVVPRDQDLALSFAQQRLWFLDQLEPESSMYNIPSAFRLRGPLDISSFERTITEITKRHEILRTTIVTVNGKPQQVISQNLPLTTPLIDLSKMEKDLQDEEVKRLAMEEANRPFKLNLGPLMRVTLLRLDDNDHAALVTMHHIISDGWSMGILMQEVSIIYEAFSKNRPSPLPALSIQYVDYAAWQRQLLQGEIYNKQLDYWRKQLADISPRLDLPTDHPRPAVQTYKGDHISFSLSKDLTAAIKDLGKGNGVTIFMTLLAAFQTLLYRYSNQDDISVGTPIAGRNRVETEGLIGFFINTLVLRTDFCGNLSFSEILQQVRKTALGAYAHQDLPFEKLVDEIQPERDISHSPLFQTMFVLQNIPKRKIQ